MDLLIKDTNFDAPLKPINAQRATRGPDGQPYDVRVAGPHVEGADVTLTWRGQNGLTSLRREVKSLKSANQFSRRLSDGAEQVKYEGEVFMQVPNGVDASRELRRFRGMRTPDELGQYRSVKVTVVNEGGALLYEGPVTP
jgi:hypothetical protein